MKKKKRPLKFSWNSVRETKFYARVKLKTIYTREISKSVREKIHTC